MLILMFAVACLWSSDAPRLTPSLPQVAMPWLEEGNRHARRRDRKLARL